MSGDDNNPEGTPPAGDGEEWTPPTKEEWEKAQRTAEVRKKERDEARREAAAAREAAAGKGKPADDDAAEKRAAAVQEASDNRARRSAGITALVEAGMSKSQAKDALALLGVSKLAVDQDGDVDEEELEDAVKGLRTKFPGLFPAANGKPPKAHTADGKGRDGATKSPTDVTTARMMKAAGLA